MKDESRPIFRLTRNESSFNPIIAQAFQNKVNGSPWFLLGPRMWKVTISGGDRQKHQALGYFWTVAYEFHAKFETWTAKPLNVGMMQKVTGGKIRIKDKYGVDVSQPQPLNSNGTAKTLGSTADALEFDVYEEADFSGLGFDPFLLNLLGS
jgi:hypothetical protein